MTLWMSHDGGVGSAGWYHFFTSRKKWKQSLGYCQSNSIEALCSSIMDKHVTIVPKPKLGTIRKVKSITIRLE